MAKGNFAYGMMIFYPLLFDLFDDAESNVCTLPNADAGNIQFLLNK